MHTRPRFTLETRSLDLLGGALQHLAGAFARLPPVDTPIPGEPGMARVLDEVATRLADNYPYFHPLYAGQMLKPPHPLARAAYALAMWLNPNNHALDGGRASSAMEKEAVAELAAMFGWSTHLGHLTGGGTMANLEALWVAERLQPGSAVVASEQAHYTHRRISAVLGHACDSIATDHRGRMDLKVLERRLARGDVGTVVATLGTTATGSVDPLPQILALRERHGFHLHVDAAYGGYFKLADNLDDEARDAFACIDEADSIVVDPHKHGLQPYGCGCVLFRDPSVGRFYKHDSPYTYFSSDALHLGEISLECSRAGAAAVALWATQRLLPLVPGGELARGLAAGHAAARALHQRLRDDARFVTPFAPQLDIVVWAPRAHSVSAASLRTRAIFETAARYDLHLAVAELPCAFFDLDAVGMRRDHDTISCLRSVLMKPEHGDWLDAIWARLDGAAAEAVRAA
jgi:glutamate/tyrosine decarboxylase-like PLP-dependent enzyme